MFQLSCAPGRPGVMEAGEGGAPGGGTAPETWRSSVRVLHEFARTKKPVKFANNVVFTQVLTTGISRSVSFKSMCAPIC